MNNREIILKCTEVNLKYMRLPAKVDGLKNLTELYKRMAKQSFDCAAAWVAGNPCPDHEPATDAFWWGVVVWAEAFGLSFGFDWTEWGSKFVQPHYDFAQYLRPGLVSERFPLISGPPADIILRLDALWMERVIQLTTKWGLMAHLKDKGALTEAQKLGADLRNPRSPAYKAFLESDLTFFRHLFKPFPFSEQTRKHINAWLKRAEEAL
ncbi:hypothetical protein ES703_66945 [subsurface metagenome]